MGLDEHFAVQFQRAEYVGSSGDRASVNNLIIISEPWSLEILILVGLMTNI